MQLACLAAAAVESVLAEELPGLALEIFAYCQPAEGVVGTSILWKFLGHFLGQFDQVHGILRKCVIASDCLAVGRQYKADGRVFRDILAGLLLEVVVERFNATRESCSIMRPPEQFDSEVAPLLLADHLDLRPFFVTFCSSDQSRTRCRGIEQSIREHLSRALVQSQDFLLANRSHSSVVCT